MSYCNFYKPCYYEPYIFSNPFGLKSTCQREIDVINSEINILNDEIKRLDEEIRIKCQTPTCRPCINEGFQVWNPFDWQFKSTCDNTKAPLIKRRDELELKKEELLSKLKGCPPTIVCPPCPIKENDCVQIINNNGIPFRDPATNRVVTGKITEVKKRDRKISYIVKYDFPVTFVQGQPQLQGSYPEHELRRIGCPTLSPIIADDGGRRPVMDTPYKLQKYPAKITPAEYTDYNQKYKNYTDNMSASLPGYSSFTTPIYIGELQNPTLDYTGNIDPNFSGKIDENAFLNTKNLDSIDFSGSEGLKPIGENTFDNTSNLASVDFSGSDALNTIGNPFISHPNSTIGMDKINYDTSVYANLNTSSNPTNLNFQGRNYIID